MIICPNCGNKLNDDMLYCEVCGTEIQFVPDYEPEIEQSINDTLSEIQLNDDEFQDYYYDENYPQEYYDPQAGYVDEYGNFIYYESEEFYSEQEYNTEQSQEIKPKKKKNPSDSVKHSQKSDTKNHKKTGHQKKKSGSFDIKSVFNIVKKDDSEHKKNNNESVHKKDFLEYKRPEALVNIKPPAPGPRVTRRLSDSLYDDMYDNDDIQDVWHNWDEDDA